MTYLKESWMMMHWHLILSAGGCGKCDRGRGRMGVIMRLMPTPIMGLGLKWGWGTRLIWPHVFCSELVVVHKWGVGRYPPVILNLLLLILLLLRTVFHFCHLVAKF